MLAGLGLPELALILVIVLLLFGPRNLPKLGSLAGRAVRRARGEVSKALDNGEWEEGRGEER